MDITPSNKKIAGHISAVFGGQPEITLYSDEAGRCHVHIVRCPDSPVEGVDSFATVGLSDYDQKVEGLEGPVRVELVGACDSGNPHFGSILANAAFCSIHSGWPLHPGAIFADIVKNYEASETLEHVLFVEPFPWDEPLEAVHLPEKEVLWLMMVPISEAEAVHAEKHGSPALEELLEQSGADVFDLQRASVK